MEITVADSAKELDDAGSMKLQESGVLYVVASVNRGNPI